MSTLKTFQDFRDEISIVELAIANGYVLSKKDGLKWPVLKDSVSGERIIIINPTSSANQGYFNPQDDKDKGTLIDFVKNRLGSIFAYESGNSEISNVNKVLYSYLKLDAPEKRINQAIINKIKDNRIIKDFVIPDGITSLQAPEYLFSRHLAASVINDELFKGKIFNVKIGNYSNNIGFPYYDVAGAIIGYEIRNKDYKHVVDGSNRSAGVWHSNIPTITEQIVLTESPIDALSYYQLKGKKNTLFVSFGGSVADEQVATVAGIKSRINLSNNFDYVSAVDNDKAGDRYTDKFKNYFKEDVVVDKPVNSDFNKDLEENLRNKRGIKF